MKVFSRTVRTALVAALLAAVAPPTGTEAYAQPLILAPSFAPVVTPTDVARYADQLDFKDAKLLAAVAKIESGYKPTAHNTYKGVTYYGLMQISYERAQIMGFTGKPKDLYNWKVNLKYAAKYLAQLKAEHGSLRKTIAAYNAGKVYWCQKKCPRGQLVNEGYVRDVMKVYVNIDENDFSEI